MDKRLSEGAWVPTVIASGSQASRQMNRLFEQGYAVEGNHLPLGLVKKRPSDFDNVLLRRLRVVMTSSDTYDPKILETSLQIVKNAAEDGGVYEICAKAVDRFFAFAAYCSFQLKKMTSRSSSNFNRIVDHFLQRLDDQTTAFDEFLGQPTLALHKAAYSLTTISHDLDSVSYTHLRAHET